MLKERLRNLETRNRGRLSTRVVCVPSAVIWAAAGLILSAGCSQPEPSSPAPPAKAKDTVPEVPVAAVTVRSDAFEPGQPIPRKYTGDGEDVSPPLRWSGLPEGTKELALIVDDPDAPSPQPWVHWVIYKIPATEQGLAEGIPADERLSASPAGALQGSNSWDTGRTIGYRGPAPPEGHGVHHYHFKLYALDAELPLEPGLDKAALLEAIDGHVLSEGKLIGTYER